MLRTARGWAQRRSRAGRDRVRRSKNHVPGLGFGRPEEAISETKRRRIAQAAQAWLREQSMEQASCRFDVIAVVLQKDAESDRYTFQAGVLGLIKERGYV